MGAVEWMGKTDVRCLHLDDLVLSEKKAVIVYEDDKRNKDSVRVWAKLL